MACHRQVEALGRIAPSGALRVALDSGRISESQSRMSSGKNRARDFDGRAVDNPPCHMVIYERKPHLGDGHGGDRLALLLFAQKLTVPMNSFMVSDSEKIRRLQW